MSAVLISLSRAPQRGIRLVSCAGHRHLSWAVEYLRLSNTGLVVVRRRVCFTRGDAKRFFSQLQRVHRVPVLPEHAYPASDFPDLSISNSGRAA